MSRWVVVRNVLSTGQLPKYDVALYYWWPGRQFEQWDDLPPRFRSLVKRARGSGSKYLVYATVTVPIGVAGETEVTGYARCMDIDIPRKSYGRNRALGKLTQKLLKVGYTLVETPGE